VLNLYKEYIIKKRLFTQNDKILLTVSGGIDSVVMLDLFIKSGFTCGIAHCNFNLRADESNKDEQFVKKLAEHYHLPFYNISFNTEEYARINNISLQMAARALRYTWFSEIKEKHHYDYIATAHNKNDVVETFLINISRGTGIKGLTGIKPKTDKIIRPILFATRNQIEIYCKENNLQFREDSSNVSIKYKRNKIRHQVIPVLEEINPNFCQTVIENIDRIKQVYQIYQASIKEKMQEIISENSENLTFEIAKLKQLKPLSTYLHEFLSPFNFSQQNILDIIEALDGIPGKQFLSSTHRLVKDRTHLIITKISKESFNRFYIEEGTTSIINPISLKFKVFENSADFKIPVDLNFAFLDYDLISFPLIIRKWQKGDYFHPLGMANLKKVSDFFIDNKLSLIEKGNIWILASENKIVWIVGKRIDDKFKITNKTKQIFEIELIK